jgi:hypothetical protein
MPDQGLVPYLLRSARPCVETSAADAGFAGVGRQRLGESAIPDEVVIAREAGNDSSRS